MIFSKWTVFVALMGCLIGGGCSAPQRGGMRQPSIPADGWMEMEVTGYCACSVCCGWHRDWRGRAVFSRGPLKGKHKEIGITASGTRARQGTAAVDTSLLPFGTLLHVPGYGMARAEDTGGAIRGKKLDLYFARHEDALDWGRQRLRVLVWYPK